MTQNQMYVAVQQASIYLKENPGKSWIKYKQLAGPDTGTYNFLVNYIVTMNVIADERIRKGLQPALKSEAHVMYLMLPEGERLKNADGNVQQSIITHIKNNVACQQVPA